MHRYARMFAWAVVAAAMFTMVRIDAGPSSSMAQSQSAGSQSAQSGVIKLPTGVSLHYAVQGRTDGQPIVLLHGVGDSWHSFELLLPHIPDTYRVYALTMRGHGWSDRPARGYAQADFADDVRQFLEVMQLSNVTLVGHSLGSLVAQGVATNGGPARVARLVLLGSGPGGMGDAAALREVSETFNALTDPIDPNFARDFQASTTSKPVPAPFFETMCTELLRVPASVWKQVVAALDDESTRRSLADVRVPTLVIWGDQDGFFRKTAQDALVSRLPHARFVVYQGTGHAPHWEEPTRVARDVMSFISGS